MDSDLELARQLVLREGWNATAYQILNPGFTLWFSRARDAVAGYVDVAGVWVVGGAPVCALERLPAVARELEEDATRCGRRVCYFAAEARLENVCGGSRGHSMILLGAQPAWDPRRWPSIVATTSSLRAQLNRARNKGVRVTEWPRERATGHRELHRCLTEWLATRGLPPMHFLVEPETLQRLYDRRIFVAERDVERQASSPVGFLVVSPVPQRNGWLVEQFVRGRAAVNGTAELMIDAAMRALAESGSDYVSLGLSPLSGRTGDPAGEGAWWLRLTLRWMRAHGKRFYNFEGLERFKAKLKPDVWEPIYAIANEPRFRVRMLLAIAAAFLM
jgi:phosphatidylglycerol lysyltransferase